MAIAIRAYQPEDVPALVEIWNEVVEHGIAFPQKAPLSNQIGAAFFAKQSCTAAAYDTETAEIVGMYILHPNNVGRCGHICNASYAVKTTYRGQKIGEQLVRHCLHQARQMGFRILQFNAVVKENYAARKLYEKLRRKTERIPILSCIIFHCKTNRPQKRKSSIIWESLGCI